MEKSTKKVPISKKLVALAPLALIAVLVGLHVYQLQELRGLRARVHTLEYARGEQLAQETQYANEKVDYEILSTTQKTVRVEDPNSYKMDQPEIKYVEKKVNVYKVKVTNNTSWTYDFVDGDIRGKTASGSLVAPESNFAVHPDDRQGPESLSLAPGGSGEVYVYIPADQAITELYYSNSSQI